MACNLITTIQIGKRQLGMDDGDYRDMLERVTGKRSSKGLSIAQKRAVIDELKRLGFESKPTGTGWRKKSERGDIRYVFVLWRLLAEAGAVTAGRKALNAWIANPNFRSKWGDCPTDATFLSIDRARDVIEALKDLCRRHQVRLDR